MLPSPVSYYVHQGGDLALPPGKAYGYFLAGNGVFKVARNAGLYACIPVAAGRIVGLPALAPTVRIAAGRLPETLLVALLRDARALARPAPIEAMYHLRLREGRAVIERPPQRGRAAHLAYNGGEAADVVMDIHSHCQMRAFFSGTDNQDEQGFRLYAVLGRIFSHPEIALRVGVYGDFWRVPVELAFTASGGLREVVNDR